MTRSFHKLNAFELNSSCDCCEPIITVNEQTCTQFSIAHSIHAQKTKTMMMHTEEVTVQWLVHGGGTTVVTPIIKIPPWADAHTHSVTNVRGFLESSRRAQ